MSDKMKVLIVDDETLARDIIKNFLTGQEDIVIQGECSNGFEAIRAVQEQLPDIIFLDIQMPKIDGFELLEILDPGPEIIFCTAYDQYAIRAFELNAVDYLLKPFSRERLLQALDKACQRHSAPGGRTNPVEHLKEKLDEDRPGIERVVTRMGSRITVIPVDKIWHIEAQDDYVMVHSELGDHLKEKTMKYFEEHLPSNFVRIHRSHIVNLNQIRTVEPYTKDTHVVILRSGASVRASQDGYRRLKEIL